MRFPIPALLALLGSVAAAQDSGEAPATQAPALAELSAAVGQAHRGGRTRPITAFRAALSLTPTQTDGDSVQIKLRATFLAPNLLRYRVEEVSEVLERGWDDRGPWARVGDRIANLSDRAFEKERAEVRQQIGLARQLLGYLDPASMIEKLEVVGTPRREILQLGERFSVPCDLVTGIAERFPMFRPPPGSAEPRCGLRLWFDAGTHLLVAIQATPLDADGLVLGVGEFLLLRNYKRQQGVAFPSVMVVFRGFPDVAGRSEARVTISAIDLDPDGVTRATMRRPTR